MDEKNLDLRQAGLRATTPRLRILAVLEESDQRHLGAEEIYMALIEAGDDVGLATVYRVLTQFEAAGLVIRHNFESGQSVFELDNREHHDHIVCLQCGRVEEFVDEVIEQHQRQIAKGRGFSIADHSLVIYGECRRENCPHR